VTSSMSIPDDRPAAVPKVVVRGLSKRYTTRSGDVDALEDINLEIADNEFVTVVGASGCGKSTLMSIAAGLQEQSAGEILVDGQPVTGPGRDRGVVLQSYTLFPWLTAQQNIEFALRDEPGLSRRERAETAREHLSLVGL
jgi:NitT/TauT family transport system ATP-binding protein